VGAHDRRLDPGDRMSVNAEWHRAHPMPKNATSEQRLAWHREHVRHCSCRQPPPDIAARLAEETATP
jgi:hypothetical protein